MAALIPNAPVELSPPHDMKYLSLATLLALPFLLSSCYEIDAIASNQQGYIFKNADQLRDPNQRVSDGFWDRPAGLTGPHVIVVDRRLQNAKYYINGTQVGLSTVSTGAGGNATPAGTYTVLEKDVDHRSSKYGSWVTPSGQVLQESFTIGRDTPIPGGQYLGATMFYGLKLNNTGIWMHEGIVTSAPESHGCIRLPTKMAKVFYDNIPIGSQVIVR